MIQKKLIDQRIKSYEALFENANELIITTDKDGLITKVNRKVEEVSGYTREELIGKSILTIATPESRNQFFRFYKELTNGNTTRHELVVAGKSGDKGHILASGSIISDGDEIVEIQYNAQEINDLKEAQATILDLKNHLKSIIESSPNMIICLDSSGGVEMANPVTEQILQVAVNDMEGKPLVEACPFMEKYKDCIKWSIENRASKFLHDEILPDSNIYNLIIYPLTASPRSGVVITAVNITEKKKMQAELIQAQKMETIGLLASGFAHDFNNILTGIVGNIAMMRVATEEEKKKKYLDSMDKISNRAKDLISLILMLSSGKVGNPQNFSICKALNEVIDLTSRSIPKNIMMNLELPSQDSILKMDYTLFTQVMLNLIINSRDAIGKKQNGRIKISAMPVWVDEKIKRQNMLAPAEKYIRIEVTDNGCGIEKENLGRIFDPFYTTKEKGEGTGLGLSITYTVIKNSGGNIRASSETGKGATFAITLPVSGEKSVSADEEVFSSKQMKSIRILLVDDESMIREIGREMLESLGHSVTTAGNGIECLDLLSKKAEKYDVLILDMIMPGLDGYHTLAEMKTRGINKKVIVSTGFSVGDDFKDLVSNPMVIANLNKPFTVHELSRVLSRVVN